MVEKLIVIAGMPGTGKTTDTKKLDSVLSNYVLIDQNNERRKLGMKRMPKQQNSTLRIIDRATASYLREGKGVIIDSCHTPSFRRNHLYGIASSLGVDVLVLECECAPETSKIRMQRRDRGDGLISDPCDPSVYDKLLKRWEPIKEYDFKYPGNNHVSFIQHDTDTNLVENVIVQRGMGKFVKYVSEIIIKNE